MNIMRRSNYNQKHMEQLITLLTNKTIHKTQYDDTTHNTKDGREQTNWDDEETTNEDTHIMNTNKEHTTIDQHTNYICIYKYYLPKHKKDTENNDEHIIIKRMGTHKSNKHEQ